MTELQGLTFVDAAEVSATFTADTERRTISGVIVPWRVAAKAGGARWRFTRGSLRWADTARVKLNLNHDRGQAIGKAIRLHNTEDGLEATFKVARGDAGDQALMLAEDGVLDGFSIEADFDDGDDDAWVFDPNDKGVRLVQRARLAGVALTGFPAFDDARADRIAATRQEGTTMTNDDQTPTTETEGAVAFEQAMTGLAEKITASHEKLTTDLAASVGESIAQGVKAALTDISAPQGAPDQVRAARFSVGTEPPVYRFNGGGHSMVRDAWAAARDRDEDAIDRLRRFRAQSEDMAAVVSAHLAFAPQTTTTAAAVIPPGYRPDLYVTELTRGRPIVQTASRGTIDNATPFTVPTFTSSTSVTADHVEGTNPSDGSVTLNTLTVTPQAISGRLVLTREIVDSSNPAIDQIAFATMRESYARQTEAKVYTLLNGPSGAGGTITSGFVPSGAQAVTTAGGTDNQTLVKAIRKAIADYSFARFNVPTAATMGQAATARLAQAVDTTQRPLFPWVGPDNAMGTANVLEGGYQVDSLRFIPAWANTGTAAGDSQIMLINSADLWVWESPLLTFRYEEKQGPANIELNVFGYFATHLLRPVGLSGIRIT